MARRKKEFSDTQNGEAEIIDAASVTADDPHASLRKKAEAAAAEWARYQKAEELFKSVAMNRELSDEAKMSAVIEGLYDLGYGDEEVAKLSARRKSGNPNDDREYFGLSWSEKRGLEREAMRARTQLEVAERRNGNGGSVSHVEAFEQREQSEGQGEGIV